MNVYQKLMEVQSKLKAPKNQFNSFGKYNYRSTEDILEGLKPLLKEVGAVVTIEDEIKLIGDRYYIEATVSFTDIEKGDTVKSKAYAREEAQKKGMDSSQLTGSTSSYARKYALNGLFAIDDTKDSDFNNQGDTQKPNHNHPDWSEMGMFKQKPQQQGNICVNCGANTPDKVASFSQSKFGKVVCYSCQQKGVK